jgi:L-aminopeptidase/D-esterase-like protein
VALGVEGFRVGHWTHAQGHTGCTVILAPEGSLGAVAIRGGAPGTREAAALGPTAPLAQCHAVVLSGGSAFGLATADGVSRWCEANGIGYDKVVARIPIVGGAIVFDLRAPGAPRPDAEAGWAACEAATAEDPAMGLVGVGAGCTVGKAAGIEWLSPGGVGWATATGGGVTVGALMAVNALGDVLDEQGQVLAGSRAPAGHPRFPVASAPQAPAPEVGESTVVGCLVTDARLSKPDACRAADLAHSGIARTVEPPHTTFDGDALFLLCAQRVEAGVDLVAHLGTLAVAGAVRAAVRAAAG